MIAKKTKTVSSKQKKCATKYLEQVTNEGLLERAEQSEENEANLAEERDLAMSSLISLEKTGGYSQKMQGSPWNISVRIHRLTDSKVKEW